MLSVMFYPPRHFARTSGLFAALSDFVCITWGVLAGCSMGAEQNRFFRVRGGANKRGPEKFRAWRFFIGLLANWHFYKTLFFYGSALYRDNFS
ncbi:hypothetical protein LSG25_07990 [Paralcaligenes sp. KSB-10]|jgi:hypothetical protein|uniref:hypothetical protein n=1 Tax=Paralcaligenes sp. KSB-10 TaxID=2901142 RepID=UPI001E37D820|nr:hypothetical protein [Paralcaligenes sp. KSB-10]UHL65800.1 hypothetical protein LSG25_07990 [Paralcaligenes sp. KSB-10]